MSLSENCLSEKKTIIHKYSQFYLQQHPNSTWNPHMDQIHFHYNHS